MKTIAAAGVLIAALLVPFTAARADVVTDWNDVGATTVLASLPSERGSVGLDLSLVHIAMYDAINAIRPRYRPYLTQQPGTNPRGASPEAAAATAAYAVLRYNFPSQTAALDASYAASLAAVPNGSAKALGVALGSEIAQNVINWRMNDGRYAVVPYTFGSGPGVYQATPPGPPSPVNTALPLLRPLALKDLGQFRAYGPPGLRSETYTQDYNETQLMGSLNSTARSAAQTEIALFHTENPNLFWPRNLRNFTAGLGLNLLDHARLMALLFVSFGDAINACFDSKYTYNFWRPVTAIRAGDTDDNGNTVQDAAWFPLANTPPHPEYPAAHGCGSGAVAEVIQRELGERISFTFNSTVANTTVHQFAGPDALVSEIINARVYGGMHFRNSVQHGVRLGRKVGTWVEENYFQPLRPSH
jgi:hypothetical protein